MRAGRDREAGADGSRLSVRGPEHAVAQSSRDGLLHRLRGGDVIGRWLDDHGVLRRCEQTLMHHPAHGEAMVQDRGSTTVSRVTLPEKREPVNHMLLGGY